MSDSGEGVYHVMNLPSIQHLTREQWSVASQRLDDEAWGIFERQQLVALVETVPADNGHDLQIMTYKANNRVYGQALIDLVLEQARLENRSNIILTASAAPELFLKNGFQNKKGTLVYQRPLAPAIKTIEIRSETKADFAEVEALINQAFWNKFQPGSFDAYLVSQLRQSAIYVPELSRLAIVNGEIAGGIFYSRAAVHHDGHDVPILTFGPLGVAPKWQGAGIGAHLLKATLKLAQEAGNRGIIITGLPTYYPRFGFQSTDHFGITLADGTAPNFLMGLELQPQGLSAIPGTYAENEFFENLSTEQADQFNQRFTNNSPQQWFPQQL